MLAVSVLGRREEAKAERRLRIIAAARDLIRKTGETDLSMRTIAQKAKVSLATPYNLFGSKRAVVIAVLEDDRDFAERLSNLHPVNAIEQIFQALALTTSYYTDDPDFYRTLWKMLLDTSGKDGGGLATPQRRARSHAMWRTLIEKAQREGLIEQEISADVLERSLSHTFNGVMLGWVVGAIDTNQMLPAAGYGYALKLKGAATKAGRERLSKKIATYQKFLSRIHRRAAAA
jgi:AcrR family transcriptional regulator